MSTSPVINSLRRKRAEVSGEIRDLEGRIHALRRDLTHIDATLKMFAPDTEPRTIKPIRPYRVRNRLFEPKELSIRVMTALRESGGTATPDAIVERIIADKGIDPVATQTIRRITMIVLKGMKRRGTLATTDETPQRWTVRP